MSFDQDPNETAQISGSDFAQMCDEMKQLRAERDDANALARNYAERMKRSDAELAEARALLGLLADIRAAVGDPTGRLMQDELVERCRKLRADNELLTAENERLATGNHSMEKEIPQLRHSVERLTAALDEYGEHQGVCPKKYHGMKDSRPCTCGLNEALATPAQ